MPSREELAWAAGLFEGEGCFYSSKNSPAACLQMTDRDIVEHFAEVVGVGTVRQRFPSGKNPRHQMQWRWEIYGLEKTQAVAAMLWAWLGPRRRSKYEAIIEHWRGRFSRYRRNTVDIGAYRTAICSAEGCERRPHARSLCQMHYTRKWREARATGAAA